MHILCYCNDYPSTSCSLLDSNSKNEMDISLEYGSQFFISFHAYSPAHVSMYSKLGILRHIKVLHNDAMLST